MSLYQENERSPLHNPLVLSMVFKFVSESDHSTQSLKNIRLVSKLWYSLSLPLWRRQATIILHPNLEEVENNGILLSKFLTLRNDIDSIEANPFRNFSFKSWELGYSNDNESRTFWNDIGPTIKSLRFDNCHFLEYIFNKIMFVTCVNLESLHLSNNFFAAFKYDGVIFGKPGKLRNNKIRSLVVSGDMRFSWDRLLEYFPNLEKIQVKHVYRLSELLPGLREARLKLAVLDLIDSGHFASASDLDLLTQTGSFSFQSLSIPVKHEVPDKIMMEALTELLKRYSTTLRKFKLFRPPLSKPMRGNLEVGAGELELLEELELWGAVFSNFNFLGGCPNLKVLRVKVDCVEKEMLMLTTLPNKCFYKWDKVEDNLVANTSSLGAILLEELQVLEMDVPFLGVAELKKVGRWMPNVRDLGVVVKDNRMFSELCRIWKEKLEGLRIMFGSDLDDDGIAGMWRSSKLGNVERKPGICDLTYLKSFQTESYCHQSKLSDTSVFQGFLKLEYLHHLEICVSPYLLSAEAIEVLQQKINHARIHGNCGIGHISHYNFCCERRVFNLRWKNEG